MYRIIAGLLFVALFCGACRKEYSQRADPETLSVIDIVCDSEDLSKAYSPDQTNDFSEYSFGGVAGNYFGYVSSFKITEHSDIEIRIGTLLSPNTVLTQAEATTLIATGRRSYGSLGAYHSFPDITPGRAEISYTDKDAVRWSSTRMKEKDTQYGIQASTELLQPQESEFIIDKVKVLNSNGGKPKFHIAGHFICIVFEVNGERSKNMHGKFTGIVSSQD